MTIDYEFVKNYFTKEIKRLGVVVKNIDFLIEDYARQLESLEKLDQNKYRSEIQKLEFKKAEAFEKLSHISPKIKKMEEIIKIIEEQG